MISDLRTSVRLLLRIFIGVLFSSKKLTDSDNLYLALPFFSPSSLPTICQSMRVPMVPPSTVQSQSVPLALTHKPTIQNWVNSVPPSWLKLETTVATKRDPATRFHFWL